jgi:hypothetical protein
LSLRIGRYFPGLLTSPILGVIGVLLWRRLITTTTSRRRVMRGPPTDEASA